jgi:hypothetical protein
MIRFLFLTQQSQGIFYMIIQKFLIPMSTEHKTNLADAFARLQDGQWDTQPHRLKIHRKCPDIFWLNDRPAWLVEAFGTESHIRTANETCKSLTLEAWRCPWHGVT